MLKRTDDARHCSLFTAEFVCTRTANLPPDWQPIARNCLITSVITSVMLAEWGLKKTHVVHGESTYVGQVVTWLEECNLFWNLPCRGGIGREIWLQASSVSWKPGVHG